MRIQKVHKTLAYQSYERELAKYWRTFPKQEYPKDVRDTNVTIQLKRILDVHQKIKYSSYGRNWLQGESYWCNYSMKENLKMHEILT